MITIRKPHRTTAIAGIAIVLAATFTVATPPVAAADPAPNGRPGPRELSRSALHGALQEADARVLDQKVRHAHRTVAERAAKAPGQLGSASVVFHNGQSASQVTDLVRARSVDLISAEAKVPVGTAGEVFTLWFNDFERVDGALETKLDRAIGKTRLRYFRQAGTAPTARRAALRELATSDIRFYRLELVGSHRTFAALASSDPVLAVLPDPDTTKVAALGQQRAARSRQHRAAPPAPAVPTVRLTSGDPARGPVGPGTPVWTNSGQRCTWQRADAILACAPGSSRTVSGDPAVDDVLPHRDGGVTAGTNGSTPSAKPGGARLAATDSWPYTACNEAGSPQTCPNDHSYRPHPDTGGRQSFGAVMYSYAEGYHVFYECYAVWVPDNSPDGNGGYWSTVCQPYVVYSPAFTLGAAAWNSTWGQLRVRVAATGQELPISTAAFKASNLPRCHVIQSGGTAHCHQSGIGVTYVPDPGIEDELLLPNPSCSGPRLGNTSDWNRGCFWPTLAASNLPGAFLDTTLLDSADTYNLAVGSSQPTLVAEGTPYSHYAEFFAYRQNNVAGLTAFHAVSVDSKVTASAACVAGGFANPFCYFPVDASRVSEKIPFV